MLTSLLRWATRAGLYFGKGATRPFGLPSGQTVMVRSSSGCHSSGTMSQGWIDLPVVSLNAAACL